MVRPAGDYGGFDERYTYPVIKDELSGWSDSNPSRRLTVERAYDLMDKHDEKPAIGRTGQHHFSRKMKAHILEKAQVDRPDLFLSPAERRWRLEPTRTERNVRTRYRLPSRLSVWHEHGRTYVAGPGYKRALTIREYQQRVKAGRSRHKSTSDFP